MIRDNNKDSTDAVIVDFGIARYGDAPPGESVRGTYGYIAP